MNKLVALVREAIGRRCRAMEITQHTVGILADKKGKAVLKIKQDGILCRCVEVAKKNIYNR
jgi:hypothetical protein